MSWLETGFNPNFRPTRGLFQGLVRQCGSYGVDYNTHIYIEVLHAQHSSVCSLYLYMIKLFLLCQHAIEHWFRRKSDIVVVCLKCACLILLQCVGGGGWGGGGK